MITRSPVLGGQDPGAPIEPTRETSPEPRPGRPAGGERRLWERARCLLPARAVFDAGDSSVECVVRNISARGALVIASPSTPLPIVFDLHIPRRNETFRALVRWSDDTQYGVAFDIRDEPQASDQTAARLRRLEREIASLKARLRELESAHAQD